MKKKEGFTKPMKNNIPQFKNDNKEKGSGKAMIQQNMLTGRK
jgi:hypothetical protein